MRLLLSFGAIFHRGRRRRRRSVLGRIIVGVHRPHFSRNFEISLDIIFFRPFNFSELFARLFSLHRVYRSHEYRVYWSIRKIRTRRPVSNGFLFSISRQDSLARRQRDTAFVFALTNQIQGGCKPCNFPGWRARFSQLPAETLRVGQTSLRSRIAVEFRSLHSMVKGCLQICLLRLHSRRSREEGRGKEMRLDVRAHRCEICKIVSAGKKEERKEGKMFQGKMAERNSENRKGGEQRVPPVNLFVTWTFA